MPHNVDDSASAHPNDRDATPEERSDLEPAGARSPLQGGTEPKGPSTEQQLADAGREIDDLQHALNDARGELDLEHQAHRDR
jgi:hypothetical protein